MTATDQLPRFEPFEPGWRRNPLEVFETLRDRAPVYRAASGTFVVSRYETAQQCLVNVADFSNRCVDHEALGIPRNVDPETDPDLAEMLEATFRGIPVDQAELSKVRTVIGSDGAEHQRQRRFLNRAFSMRRVREQRPKMDELAARSVAKIATAQSWDAMEDLASIIPRRIMGEMLDVESERQPDLTRWTAEMMAATTGADRRSLASRQRLLDVLAEFTTYFVPKIDAKRANPGDDFISDLVRAEGGETLSSLETLLAIRLLMIAGTDTTAALIGNTVLALVRRPDQAEILLQDPSLIPNAIEESLRYWAPFYFVMREPVRDVVVEGVDIPAGSLVAIMLASANQDAAAFADPHVFDVRRPAGQAAQIAFGHGVHRCVGASLAREEADAALRAVLPHLSRFTLADTPLELAEAQLLQGFRHITLVRK